MGSRDLRNSLSRTLRRILSEVERADTNYPALADLKCTILLRLANIEIAGSSSGRGHGYANSGLAELRELPVLVLFNGLRRRGSYSLNVVDPKPRKLLRFEVESLWPP